MNGILQFCKMMGLHPTVGFGMFAVDQMLFGGELGTMGVSLPFSVSVAVFLVIGCVLIQKSSFKDDWGSAVGKGLIIGVLTAIPTSLPSIVPFIGGVMGTAVLLSGDRNIQRKF